MSIKQFVVSLLPSLDKTVIESDVRRIRKELVEQVVPMYLKVEETFRKWQFKGTYATQMDRNFQRIVKSRIRGNFISVTSGVMEKNIKNLDVLEKSVQDLFGDNIVRSALTYNRTQIIQLLQAYELTVRYSRLMLIKVLGDEALALDKREQQITLTKTQEKYLTDNQEVFVKLMSATDISVNELEKLLKSIPEATVDTDDSGVEAVVGLSKLDPMKLSNAVRSLNPIYHIRMAWEDWMFSRAELAAEELQLLEYQLIDLQNRQNQVNDPKLEKAIAYTQERIDKLNYKLDKMRER